MRNTFLIFAFSFLFTSLAFSQETAGDDYTKLLKKHRKDYKKALLLDERSPFTSKKEAKSIGFFEANEDYIVKCLFVRTPGEQPFDMDTYAGVTKPYIKYGELLFELPGKGTRRVAVYQSLKALKSSTFKDHLFIPFKDATNGDSTYAGGRYLDIRESDIKGGIVFVDFNKAYNPWCAYGDGFSCPVPPAENHLNFSIEAGELSFDNQKVDLEKS